MVKTPCFGRGEHRFDPWLGNKDPACHVEWQKIFKKKERKKENHAVLDTKINDKAPAPNKHIIQLRTWDQI